MKHILTLLTVSATMALPSVNAASLVLSYEYNGLGAAIPDGNPIGLANLQTVVSPITTIEDITVTLDIAGDFNGDLYVYLQHDAGFAVLMNRVGRTAGNLFGSADAGVTASFNDLAGTFVDVHLASSGSPLTGTFSSDARAVDPDLVTDLSPRTADLNSFTGLDANGDWTLFLADMSGGGNHSLNGWSMTITGVPEPGTTALLALGTAILARRRRC